MKKANESGLAKAAQQLIISSYLKQGLKNGMEKLEIMEALRKDFLQKCSLKLSRYFPQLHLKRLTMEEITNATGRKLKLNLRSTKIIGKMGDPAKFGRECSTEIEIGPVKVERLDPAEVNDYDNDPDMDSDRDADDDMEYLGVSDVDMDNSQLPPQNLKKEKKEAVDQSRETETSSSTNIKYSFIVRRPKLPPKEASEGPQSTYNPATDRHSCNLCLQTFSQTIYFQRHFDSAHLKIRFECRLCRKRFNCSRSYRRHHQVIHMGIPEPRYYKPPQYKCRLCNETFSATGHLKQHLQLAHVEGDKNKSRTCAHCGTQFPSLPEFKKHLMTLHESLRKHKCEICGKGFNQKSNLDVHRGRMTCTKGPVLKPVPPAPPKRKPAKPPPNYLCHFDKCGAGFAREWNLHRHIRSSHQQIRKHPCDLCGKRFTEAYRRNRHVENVHHRIRKHKCELCGFNLTRKDKLADHMKIHIEMGETAR